MYFYFFKSIYWYVFCWQKDVGVEDIVASTMHTTIELMLKILVIDDERSFRQPLASFLKVKGYEVYEASSVGEAMLLIGEKQLDLIVLDLVFPETLQGEYVVKHVYGRIPVLVVSNKENDHSILHLLNDYPDIEFIDKYGIFQNTYFERLIEKYFPNSIRPKTTSVCPVCVLRGIPPAYHHKIKSYILNFEYYLKNFKGVVAEVVFLKDPVKWGEGFAVEFISAEDTALVVAYFVEYIQFLETPMEVSPKALPPVNLEELNRLTTELRQEISTVGTWVSTYYHDSSWKSSEQWVNAFYEDYYVVYLDHHKIYTNFNLINKKTSIERVTDEYMKMELLVYESVVDNNTLLAFKNIIKFCEKFSLPEEKNMAFVLQSRFNRAIKIMADTKTQNIEINQVHSEILTGLLSSIRCKVFPN